MPALTAAAAAVSTAGLGIGTADAFGAAFLGLIDIEGCAAQDGQDNGNNQKINHSLFLSAEGCFCLQLVVRIDAQEHHDACHDDHSQRTGPEP